MFLTFASALYAMPPAASVIVGDVRVQALSPTLLRVEPKGPAGFEDRTTFMVTSRGMPGLAIQQRSTPSGVLLATDYYTVLLKHAATPAATPQPSFTSFAVSSPSGELLYDSE